MSVETKMYDASLLREYSSALMDRLTANVFQPTEEWKAWAAEWREEVPLTAEQKRENEAWRAHVAIAKERLARAQGSYESAIESIQNEFGLSVMSGGGCGCCEDDEGPYVDDSSPPHGVQYRTKDGASPEPPMFGTVKYQTVQFRRT